VVTLYVKACAQALIEDEWPSLSVLALVQQAVLFAVTSGC
jgi:hypothetical protein